MIVPGAFLISISTTPVSLLLGLVLTIRLPLGVILSRTFAV